MKTRLSAEAAETANREALARKALAMSAEESRMDGTGRGKEPHSGIGPKC
jgi:hypothetical protein